MTWKAIVVSFLMWIAVGSSPSAAVSPSDWPTVAPGEMDTDSVMVSMIQYLLRGRGYHVVVDGDFGRETQRQIRAFQHSHGLRVTGSVNGRTWMKLIVVLRRGSQGDAVRAVQASLQQEGDEKLPIDGKFGARTERDVRTFQKSNKLRVDGIVGPTTWLCLTDPVPD